MFSNLLKNLRLERNLTQQKVADSLQISRSVLSNYESGSVEPTLSVLKKIADYFEISADYLLGREDDFGNIVINSPAAPALELTTEERELIASFRRMPPKLQKIAIDTLHSFAGDRETQQSDDSITVRKA